MKISLLQYNPKWEDKAYNISLLKEMLDAQYNGSDLLILPEMTLTGFSMNAAGIAEEPGGMSMQFFSEIAASYNTAIIAGYVEESNGNFYNTLAVINPDGSLQSAYRKIHPFGYAGEDEHYTAGEKPVTAEVAGVKTGLAVCYDLRFPELFRFYGKDEVPLIVIIANWPRQRIAHWRALLKARAIENLCFVAAVNRTGSDPKAVYNGYSSVFSPMGEEILTLPGESAVASIEIDTNEADAIKNKFPFLKDIRLI